MNKVTFARGFTLIEFMVTVTIMAIVASAGMPYVYQKMEDTRAKRAEHEIEQILVQAREHRLATGAWPASVATLITANRLPSDAATSPYGTPFTLSVVAGNNLQLSLNTGSAGAATRLAGSELPFVNRAGNLITTRVTPAGQEAGNNALYALDGSRALTGNMNAAGNSINNVNQINATGNITTSANVQGSRVVATDLVLSQNGFAARSNPAYVLRPDGNSNIRNLTAEEIRGTYLRSEGQIHAQGSITANGSITAGSGIGAAWGSISGDLGVGGHVTANSLYVNNNLEATTVTGRSMVASPIIRATNRMQSDRFESISNPGYHVTPAGQSWLSQVYADSTRTGYLEVVGNADVRGGLTVGNGLSVTGNLNSTNNITSQNTIYSRNGFASLNNSSFVVIPDGVSTVNRINANYLQGGTVTATGDVNGQRFVDTNNPAKVVDPSGLTDINNLTVTGRANVLDLTMLQNSAVGQPCIANSIGISASGDLLSCKSGLWATAGGGGGSTVITGYYSDGEKIPFPVGFTKPQCTVSVANALNPHGGNPTRFGGEFAEYNATTRVGRCGFYDSGNKYASGQCAYTVSCSTTAITTSTGPMAGESTTQYYSYQTGTSGLIQPISGFSKSSCTIFTGSQIPGMSMNVSDNPSNWSYSCSGTAAISAPNICNANVTCTY